MPKGFKRIGNSLFDLWVDFTIEVDAILSQERTEVVLGNLVSRLILSVVAVSVLNGIVRQVNIPVLEICQLKCIRRCPNVPLLEEISSEMDPIHYLCQPKHPYIKLAHRCIGPELASNQKRIDDVLLDDPLVAAVALQELHQLLDVPEYSDTSASVAILSWLTNPGDSIQLFDVSKFWRSCHI